MVPEERDTRSRRARRLRRIQQSAAVTATTATPRMTESDAASAVGGARGPGPGLLELLLLGDKVGVDDTVGVEVDTTRGDPHSSVIVMASVLNRSEGPDAVAATVTAPESPAKDIVMSLRGATCAVIVCLGKGVTMLRTGARKGSSVSGLSVCQWYIAGVKGPRHSAPSFSMRIADITSSLRCSTMAVCIVGYEA